MMRRSVAVTASCLSFALFVVVMVLAANRYVEDAIPFGKRASADFFPNTIEFSVGIICAAVATWSAVISVGILRLRPWARLSALWLGGFVVLVSSLGLGSVVFMIVNLPGLGWKWARVLPVSTVLALGTWWLILFSRPSVKRQFGPQTMANRIASPD